MTRRPCSSASLQARMRPAGCITADCGDHFQVDHCFGDLASSTKDRCAEEPASSCNLGERSGCRKRPVTSFCLASFPFSHTLRALVIVCWSNKWIGRWLPFEQAWAKRLNAQAEPRGAAAYVRERDASCINDVCSLLRRLFRLCFRGTERLVTRNPQ